MSVPWCAEAYDRSDVWFTHVETDDQNVLNPICFNDFVFRSTQPDMFFNT